MMNIQNPTPSKTEKFKLLPAIQNLTQKLLNMTLHSSGDLLMFFLKLIEPIEPIEIQPIKTFAIIYTMICFFDYFFIQVL